MVDYEFYIETYKGASIPLVEWPMYEVRAAEQLAYYKRIYTVTAPEEDSEKMAVCALADTLAYFVAAQNGTGGAVSSASIGSVSVSYGSAANSLDLSAKGQARELMRCAKLYLGIYRGRTDADAKEYLPGRLPDV